MSNGSNTSLKEYQGAQISTVPAERGLYAWYYRPRVGIQKASLVNTLSRFLNPENTISTTIATRYGIQLTSKAKSETVVGSDKQSVNVLLDTVFDDAESFLLWFFHEPLYAHFCRPIYIGIAKNLHSRVYTQHYEKLIDYWDPDSRICKYVGNNPEASVQNAMDALDIPHSFALEARVHGIRAHELMVSVLATDKIPEEIGADDFEDETESKTRRALERLLQLLADPICGRR